VPGSEFSLPLDTLIVTIGDEPDIDYITSMGIEIGEKGRIETDPETLMASRPGVFAGGDVVTGPNTVVDAIAAGKKAAAMIARYLRGKEMRQTPEIRRPYIYVPPCRVSQDELKQTCRAQPPTLPLELRKQSFGEVEMSLSEEEAVAEARRCLRCDLEFTAEGKAELGSLMAGAKST
jgi:heterodisulfide reductase subunit A-like polyferredoxin